MRVQVLLLGLVVGFALTGCDTVRENAGDCPVPPGLKSELRAKPPVSEDEQIWQPGYWDWNGTSYSWREGNWIKRKPEVTNLWMDGYWKRDKVPAPCYWVPAHWLS